MKKISFVWFAYKNDFKELMLSIESVLLSRLEGYEYDLHVLDDGNNPLSYEQSNKIKESATYQKTYWNRNGNLKGPAQLISETEIYSNLAKDSVVVKIDCDMIMVNQDWLKTFAENPKRNLAGAFLHGAPQYVWGCYALKGAEVINALYEDAKRVEAHPYAFEDYEVCARIYRLVGDDGIERYPLTQEAGFFLGQVVPDTLKSIDAFMNMRVVTVGYGVTNESRPMCYNLMEQIVEKMLRNMPLKSKNECVNQ